MAQALFGVLLILIPVVFLIAVVAYIMYGKNGAS
jgi:hypothetical protein